MPRGLTDEGLNQLSELLIFFRVRHLYGVIEL